MKLGAGVLLAAAVLARRLRAVVLRRRAARRAEGRDVRRRRRRAPALRRRGRGAAGRADPRLRLGARHVARRHGGAGEDAPRARARPQGLRLVEPPRGRLLARRPRRSSCSRSWTSGTSTRAAVVGALVGLVGRAGDGARRARARHAHRPLRRVGLRGAAADDVPLGARAAASARRSSTSSTPSGADEKMARAFYDPKKYVTERFVEEVERALDRPGHDRGGARGRARPALRRACRSSTATVKQPVLLLWGARTR